MKNQPTRSYEQCLEDFFSEVSPEELKKTILFVYMNYLMLMDMKDIPNEFNSLAEDILVITLFLDEMKAIQELKSAKKVSLP